MCIPCAATFGNYCIFSGMPSKSCSCPPVVQIPTFRRKVQQVFSSYQIPAANPSSDLRSASFEYLGPNRSIHSNIFQNSVTPLFFLEIEFILILQTFLRGWNIVISALLHLQQLQIPVFEDQIIFDNIACLSCYKAFGEVHSNNWHFQITQISLGSVVEIVDFDYFFSVTTP